MISEMKYVPDDNVQIGRVEVLSHNVSVDGMGYENLMKGIQTAFTNGGHQYIAHMERTGNPYNSAVTLSRQIHEMGQN